MNRPRIVVLDAATNGRDLPRPGFDHEWIEYNLTSDAEVADRIRNADIAVSNKTPIGTDAIGLKPRLKMISIAATGYNHIDIGACARNGIVVSNVRNYAGRGIAEHAMGMLLCILKNIHNHHRSVREGKWQESETFWLNLYPALDLHGRNLGIFGAGSLGRATGRLAEAMGMNVRYLLRSEMDGLERMDRDTLLAWSDVVSLHCPVTADNAGMVNESFLGRMKDRSILLNTARGGLVDHEALKAALQSGKLFGAGLDVLDPEPPPENHPMINFSHPGLLVTPHVAWISETSLDKLTRQVIANIEQFMAGNPQNTVEPQ